jgi:hypothetical protein
MPVHVTAPVVYFKQATALLTISAIDDGHNLWSLDHGGKLLELYRYYRIPLIYRLS